MRYFIYCRKSSESEDRQVASIESQLTTLQRTFGANSDIRIVGVYEESFSAKAPGRPRFGEMISRIEAGNADGIIAWAPDRLARNSIDGGRVIYMLDRGTVKDLKFATYTFENNSQGKFMLQIMFGQSKYYSDALSDNVKRGNRTKIEKGWRPSKAPLGYLNDQATSTITKDPERFDRIRQMFDLLLTGTCPRKIWEIARKDWDFRTPRRRHIGGRLIALSCIYRILADRFYAGIIMWNGRTYPGAHEPVLSLVEFERVQTLLRKPEKPRPHIRSFAFTGMIRCGECRLLVTAEEKTNRHGSHYTYYHCTRRRIDYRCRQPSLSKANMEAQIEALLDRLIVPTRLHDWAIDCISQNLGTHQSAYDDQRRVLQQQLEKAQSALANLTALRVRDLINDDEFIAERRRLETDSLRIRQQLDEQEQTTTSFEPLVTLISFRNRAMELFRRGDNDTKRFIFGITSSNPVLKDKILSVEAKRPFRIISDDDPFPQMRGVRDDIRTLYANGDPELLKILANIRTLEIKFGIRSEDNLPHAKPRPAV